LIYYLLEYFFASDIEPDERKEIKQSGKTRNETEVSARLERKID